LWCISLVARKGEPDNSKSNKTISNERESVRHESSEERLKKAESHAMRGEDELKTYYEIFHRVRDIILVISVDGKVLDANDVAVKEYGYTRKELLSKTVYDLRIPALRPLIRDQLMKACKEGYLYETMHMRKDGTTFPVEVNAKGVLFDSTQVIVGVLRNLSERKALELYSSRLAAIVEYSHDALLNIAPDGTILVWNKGAELLYGYKANEVLGKNISVLVPPERSEEPKQIIGTVLSGNVVDKFETVRYGKDGRRVDVSVVAAPIVDANGKVTAISWTARDISERKRVEMALRESEQIFRATFEQAAVGISQTSVDGRFIRVNQKLCDILGYTREELLQLNFVDITYPTDIDYDLTYLRRLIAGEINVYSIEKRNVRKDGAIIWANITASLVRQQGKPKYFIRVIEDITKRKRTEDALRYSEEKFRAVYDGADIGIIMIDKNGIIIDVNPAFQIILGYTREEMIHRFISDITSVEDIDRSNNNFNQMVDGTTDHYRMEIRYVRKDNCIVWARLAMSAVRASDGGLLYAICMVEDITEMKQAETDLIETKSQVELYLDILSHDILNMNQIASGYLELAKEKIETNKENEELLEKPYEAIKNSTNLINSLKKLRTITHKEYKYDRVSVSEYIKEVISEYSFAAGDRKITINLSQISDCRVRANNLLRDVFSNLIGNSIKHSKGRLTINIKLERITDLDKQQFCRISIEDNGPGIPDERKCEIFERFKKGYSKTRGTGLGLYIVKTLVDDFQGSIWVEDRVLGDYKQGSRFVITLPVAED
jgi:PAS domain S-box-containing protein